MNELLEAGFLPIHYTFILARIIKTTTNPGGLRYTSISIFLSLYLYRTPSIIKDYKDDHKLLRFKVSIDRYIYLSLYLIYLSISKYLSIPIYLSLIYISISLPLPEMFILAIIIKTTTNPGGLRYISLSLSILSNFIF